jgi:four helix bundle protein
MQRSAVSICSNIAETDERDSDKDAVRFFYIAKGSAAELITQVEIARDAALLVAAVAEPLIERSELVSRMLGALIQARKPSSTSSP